MGSSIFQGCPKSLNFHQVYTGVFWGQRGEKKPLPIWGGKLLKAINEKREKLEKIGNL